MLHVAFAFLWLVVAVGINRSCCPAGALLAPWRSSLRYQRKAKWKRSSTPFSVISW